MGEKRELYLCAMLTPPLLLKSVTVSVLFKNKQVSSFTLKPWSLVPFRDEPNESLLAPQVLPHPWWPAGSSPSWGWSRRGCRGRWWWPSGSRSSGTAPTSELAWKRLSTLETWSEKPDFKITVAYQFVYGQLIYSQHVNYQLNCQQVHFANESLCPTRILFSKSGKPQIFYLDLSWMMKERVAVLGLVCQASTTSSPRRGTYKWNLARLYRFQNLEF